MWGCSLYCLQKIDSSLQETFRRANCVNLDWHISWLCFPDAAGSGPQLRGDRPAPLGSGPSGDVGEAPSGKCPPKKINLSPRPGRCSSLLFLRQTGSQTPIFLARQETRFFRCSQWENRSQRRLSDGLNNARCTRLCVCVCVWVNSLMCHHMLMWYVYGDIRVYVHRV